MSRAARGWDADRVSPRLVIVDDSALYRSAAGDLLRADGFDVVAEAADGRSGLAAIVEHRPDVVVLDVALPDQDGFAVAAQAMHLPSRPDVVLVSSRDWTDLDQRIDACGARGFLPKDQVDGAAVLALTRRPR